MHQSTCSSIMQVKDEYDIPSPLSVAGGFDETSMFDCVEKNLDNEIYSLPLSDLVAKHINGNLSSTLSGALHKKYRHIPVGRVIDELEMDRTSLTSHPAIFNYLAESAVRSHDGVALDKLWQELVQQTSSHFKLCQTHFPECDQESIASQFICVNVNSVKPSFQESSIQVPGAYSILAVENAKKFEELTVTRRSFLSSKLNFETEDEGARSGVCRQHKQHEIECTKCICQPFVPSLSSYGSLIRGFGQQANLNKVYWIWNHLFLYSNHIPESMTYGCLLDAMVQSNEVNQALKIFRHMQNSNDEMTKPNTIMYSTLIKGFARTKSFEPAIDLYKEMVEHNVPVNTVTFNSLVNACARVGAMKEAAKILEQMMKLNIQPDLVTFSTVVKGYCIKGEIERAFRLMLLLKQKGGIQPDSILYNTLLDGCVRYKKLALCESVWNCMVNEDNIAPSNFTLTIFIKLYGKLGQMNKVFQIIEEFPKKYNFELNAHVFTCVMSACINNHQYDKIIPMFKKLLELREATKNTSIPDLKSYETALSGLHKGRLFQDGIEILALFYNLPNNLWPGMNTERNNGARLSKKHVGMWLEALARKRHLPVYRSDVEACLRKSFS